MMAVKALLLGIAYEQVAALHAVPEKTLSRWVGRFNESGIDGLIEGRHTGRPQKITPQDSSVYEELIQHPERVDQTHWTGKKFHGYLTKEPRPGDRVSHCGALVARQRSFRLKVPRSWPDGQDEKKRRFFVEQLQGYLSDPDIDLWYLDEKGVEVQILGLAGVGQKRVKRSDFLIKALISG